VEFQFDSSEVRRELEGIPLTASKGEGLAFFKFFTRGKKVFSVRKAQESSPFKHKRIQGKQRKGRLDGGHDGKT